MGGGRGVVLLVVGVVVAAIGFVGFDELPVAVSLGIGAFLAVVAAIWFGVRWRRETRRAEAWHQFRCAQCGYDLRGSPPPFVCPECGTANASIDRVHETLRRVSGTCDNPHSNGGAAE